MKSFIAHAATSSGKGPSSMTHYRADRSTQIPATKTHVAQIVNKLTWQENNNPHVIMLASGVRHRPLKRRNREGTFVNKNKLKKGSVKSIQKYACRFGKTTIGGQIHYSWGKCWCPHWLPFSLWPGTTWRKFPSCFSCWFGWKKVPCMQGGNLKKKKRRSANSQKISHFICRCCEMLWQHLLPLYHVMCKKYKEMTVEDVRIAMDTFTLLMPNHLCFLHWKRFLETTIAKLKWWEGPLCSITVVGTKTFSSYLY